MTQSTWSAVDELIQTVVRPDTVLDQALARAEAAGLPAIQVSAAQGRMLQILAQVHGARRILEIGTLGGYSTIWMARGLVGDEPRLTTLEIDPVHAAVAEENITRAGLAGVVDILVGRAVDTLGRLIQDGVEPYDMVFVDADKPSNVAYLEAALQLTRRGSVIVVDNVVRAGLVVDPGSTDPAVTGTRALYARVAGDDRLAATVVQTVGSKGYDGFMLIRVAA
ncbi:O-methyltransferase [Actinotalea sp. K2]|uniref:O-methyltransferase n=1 Tax=Actinotalea sp. K2 TaxID=2939438 RepID=UPI002016FA9D|nr:O-methyltransferase [Actinotalea sp. K2]MCL3862028.1 O-methyltransferase [Actinotalea sp. K2]